jgi:hypothetical protein
MIIAMTRATKRIAATARTVPTKAFQITWIIKSNTLAPQSIVKRIKKMTKTTKAAEIISIKLLQTLKLRQQSTMLQVHMLH